MKKKFGGSSSFDIDSILKYYRSQIRLIYNLKDTFAMFFDILVKTTKIDLQFFFSVLYLSESKVLEVIKTTSLGFILPTFKGFC